MIVVTGYSKDGGYDTFLEKWWASVRKHIPNASVLVVDYGNQPRWRSAAHMKPRCILKAWRADQGDVLWIDVDAEVLRSPSLLLDPPLCDVAFRQAGTHSMTGTFLARRDSAMAGRLIEQWADQSVGSNLPRNQLVFESVVQQMQSRLVCHNLPPEFCCVTYDQRDSKYVEGAVIIHHMHAKQQRALGRK